MVVFELDERALELLGARLDEALQVRASDLDAATSALVVGMILRTQSGRDIEGQSFAPYAAHTAAERASRGRTTQPVTLSDTGALLANIQHRVEGDHALVYFSDARLGQRAMWLHEGTKHLPARPWFGFHQRELDEAGSLIVQRIARRLGAG